MDEGSIIKRGRKSILKYLIQLYKLTDRKYCYNPDLLAEPGRLAELEHGHVVVEPVGFEVRMSTVGKSTSEFYQELKSRFIMLRG